MSKTVSLSIPHQLGQDEAKRRIDTAIRQLGRKYVHLVSLLETRWSNNILNGSLRALGQTVKGSVEVQPASIRVDLTLPVLVAVFASKIEAFATNAGRRILS